MLTRLGNKPRKRTEGKKNTPARIAVGVDWRNLPKQEIKEKSLSIIIIRFENI